MGVGGAQGRSRVASWSSQAAMRRLFHPCILALTAKTLHTLCIMMGCSCFGPISDPSCVFFLLSTLTMNWIVSPWWKKVYSLINFCLNFSFLPASELWSTFSLSQGISLLVLPSKNRLTSLTRIWVCHSTSYRSLSLLSLCLLCAASQPFWATPNEMFTDLRHGIFCSHYCPLERSPL